MSERSGVPATERGRWWFYTVETAAVGTRGPFGPVQAHDEGEARRIAEARARDAGLTVERVERDAG